MERLRKKALFYVPLDVSVNQGLTLNEGFLALMKKEGYELNPGYVVSYADTEVGLNVKDNSNKRRYFIGEASNGSVRVYLLKAPIPGMKYFERPRTKKERDHIALYVHELEELEVPKSLWPQMKHDAILAYRQRAKRNRDKKIGKISQQLLNAEFGSEGSSSKFDVNKDGSLNFGEKMAMIRAKKLEKAQKTANRKASAK